MEVKINNDVNKKEERESIWVLPILMFVVFGILAIMFWFFVLFFRDSSPTQISETRELCSCIIIEARIGGFGDEVVFVLEEDIAEKGNDADRHRVRVKDFATFLDCVAHEGQKYMVWKTTKIYDNGDIHADWEIAKNRGDNNDKVCFNHFYSGFLYYLVCYIHLH